MYTLPESPYLPDILSELLFIDPNAVEDPDEEFKKIKRAEEKKARALVNKIRDKIDMQIRAHRENADNPCPTVHPFWERTIRDLSQQAIGNRCNGRIESQRTEDLVKDFSQMLQGILEQDIETSPGAQLIRNYFPWFESENCSLNTMTFEQMDNCILDICLHIGKVIEGSDNLQNSEKRVLRYRMYFPHFAQLRKQQEDFNNYLQNLCLAYANAEIPGQQEPVVNEIKEAIRLLKDEKIGFYAGDLNEHTKICLENHGLMSYLDDFFHKKISGWCYLGKFNHGQWQDRSIRIPADQQIRLRQKYILNNDLKLRTGPPGFPYYLRRIKTEIQSGKIIYIKEIKSQVGVSNEVWANIDIVSD